MAKDFSFDVASEYDLSVMINAVDQASREIATRYDFNGTASKIVFDKDNGVIEIESNSELKLEAMEGVLESKFLKAGLSLKFLDKTGEIHSNNLMHSKKLPLIHGLDQAKAKEITALVRAKFPKVKTQIQGEVVRVTSGSKNDLQSVMTELRTAKIDFPLNFDNFR